MEERPVEVRFAPKNINCRLVGDLRGNSTVTSDQILISLKVLPCNNVLIHRAVHTYVKQICNDSPPYFLPSDNYISIDEASLMGHTVCTILQIPIMI